VPVRTNMPVSGTPVDESNIHNLKDILSTYNRITESCFARCASNFNQNHLSVDEQSCVEQCGEKFVSGNHMIMATFVELQSRKQQQLLDEAVRLQRDSEGRQ